MKPGPRGLPRSRVRAWGKGPYPGGTGRQPVSLKSTKTKRDVSWSFVQTGRWRPGRPQFRSLTGYSAWLAQRRHPAVTRGQEHACLPRRVPARPRGTGDKGSSLSPGVLGTLPSKTEWEGEEALLSLPHPRQHWERFTICHHPRLTRAVECSGTVCQDPQWETRGAGFAWASHTTATSLPQLLGKLPSRSRSHGRVQPSQPSP